MQSIIYRIGTAITSISAVILVLMLTIVAMIFFSHNVFYETLPDTMIYWERQVAAWAIACSWGTNHTGRGYGFDGVPFLKSTGTW
jgi:hypothetical protein